MGRGRQKAKATKQARDMKYFSPATDLSALERELAGGRSHGGDQYAAPGDSSDEFEYADYADKYADYDDADDTEDDDYR